MRRGNLESVVDICVGLKDKHATLFKSSLRLQIAEIDSFLFQ